MRKPISLGQALLILIDKYKSDESKKSELLFLYFMGVRTQKDKDMIPLLLQDPALQDYTVSFAPSVIDDDPTRRYFETHFAFETLKSELKKLDWNDLQSYYRSITSLAYPFVIDKVNSVIAGTNDENSAEVLEYSHGIKMILNDPVFKLFTDEEKEKLKLLVTISYFGVVFAQATDKFLTIKRMNTLPLDIYNISKFSEEQRGKFPKKDQQTVFSQYFGIFKSHMPLAQSDSAMQEMAQQFLRASDKSGYNENAYWPAQIFSTLINPVVNTISGTTLIQLRLMRGLQNIEELPFKNLTDFINYIKNFVSILMSITGGHTFYEYLAPIFLDIVKTNFKFIPGFDQLNEYQLMVVDNESAFRKAINEAIEYNQSILNKVRINEEIEENNFWKLLENDHIEISELVSIAAMVLPFSSINDEQANALFKRLLKNDNKNFIDIEVAEMFINFHPKKMSDKFINMLVTYNELIKIADKNNNSSEMKLLEKYMSAVVQSAYGQIDIKKLADLFAESSFDATISVVLGIGETLKILGLEKEHHHFNTVFLNNFFIKLLKKENSKTYLLELEKLLNKLHELKLLSPEMLKYLHSYLSKLPINSGNAMVFAKLASYLPNNNSLRDRFSAMAQDTNKEFLSAENVLNLIHYFNDNSEEFINILLSKMRRVAVDNYPRNSAYNFLFEESLIILNEIKMLLPNHKFSDKQLNIFQSKFSRNDNDLKGSNSLNLNHCLELAELYIKYDFYRPIPEDILDALIFAYEQSLVDRVKIATEDDEKEVSDVPEVENDSVQSKSTKDTQSTQSQLTFQEMAEKRSQSTASTQENEEENRLSQPSIPTFQEIETASTASTLSPETINENDNTQAEKKVSKSIVPDEIKDIYYQLEQLLEQQRLLSAVKEEKTLSRLK